MYMYKYIYMYMWIFVCVCVCVCVCVSTHLSRTCAHGLREEVAVVKVAGWVGVSGDEGVEVEASARCEPAAADRDICRRKLTQKRPRRQCRRSRARCAGRHPGRFLRAVFGVDSAESDCAGCVERGCCRRGCITLP